MKRWTLTRMLFYLWLGCMVGGERQRNFVAGLIGEFAPDLDLLVDEEIAKKRGEHEPYIN